MNIVFLTLGYPTNINERNLYTDLMSSFVNLGHSVYVFMQDETGNKEKQKSQTGVTVIPVYTGKIKQTGLIKKGVNLLLLGQRYYKIIKENIKGNIDLLLYSTPPITFCNIIKTIKKKYNCINYLLLKDIFPQNAVDLRMFSQKSIIYKYFRIQEKKLYKNSDLIGCMSPANVNYLLNHNPQIEKTKVHVSPNCMIPDEQIKSVNPHDELRLIYGGNLGKPQGIDFIIECCKVIEKYENVKFTIIGSGTEYEKLNNAIKNLKQTQLFSFKPMNEYLAIMEEQDVGMIFLDSSFTIPNFPSRTLDYLNKSIPVFACTDSNSDIKQEICDLDAGIWCKSDSIEDFEKCLKVLIDINKKNAFSEMRSKAKNILQQKYNAKTEAEKICDRVLALNKLQ